MLMTSFNLIITSLEELSPNIVKLRIRASTMNMLWDTTQLRAIRLLLILLQSFEMQSQKSTLVTDQILKKSLTIFGNFTSLHHCPPNSLSVHASFNAYIFFLTYIWALCACIRSQRK